MTQNLNQFSQSAERGQIPLLGAEGFVVSAIVDSTSATINAGDAVEIITTSKGIPKVKKLANATNAVFGFAIYNPVKNANVAGDRIEVMITGGVMYMIASEVINAGVEVEYNITTGKIAPYVVDSGITPNTIVGKTIDYASGNNILTRVYIKSI